MAIPTPHRREGRVAPIHKSGCQLFHSQAGSDFGGTASLWRRRKGEGRSSPRDLKSIHAASVLFTIV